MRNGKKIIIYAIVCVLLCAVVFPMNVSAAQSVDTDQICQLQIRYFFAERPVTGAQFHVYKIGDVKESGICTLTDPFADYPVDTAHLSSGVLSDSAELLYSYALLDELEPDAVMTVNDAGIAEQELPVGFYLVAGQKFADNNGKYTTGPMIVSLPHRMSEADPWAYDITLEPKCNYQPKERMGEINRSAMKIWRDGNSDSRPREIKVSLLRDTEVVDTVALNASNRWTHKWTSLSEAYEWRVVEEVVDGYSVDVDLVLGVFLVTNTKTEEPTEPTTEPTEPTTVPTEPTTEPTEPTTEPTEPTTEPTEPTTEPTEPTTEPTEPTTEPTEPTTEPTEPTTEPTEPTTEPTEPTTNPTEPTTEPTDPGEATQPTTEPIETTAPTKPGESDTPKLPQTGMLWWPVPVLAMLGLFLICAGVLIRKDDHHA